MVCIGLREAEYVIHTVVCRLASKSIKAVKRNHVSLLKRSKVNDLNTVCLTEGLKVCGDTLSLDIHALIGTECGKNLGGESALGDLLVILKRISGIVGGAKKVNVGVYDQVLCAHRGRSKLLSGNIPDRVTVLLAENQVTVKVTLKLKMAPVIKRIADQLGHNGAVRLELIIVRTVAGDVLLIYAAGAHCSPLIVVAVQPNLGNVGITLILCDLLGGKVTVIIDNGQLFRIIVEKDLRSLSGKKEIFIHKLLHSAFSFTMA